MPRHDNAVPGAVGSEAATVPVLGAVVEVSMMSGIERAQTK
jgi:hypothetical protein